MFSSAQEERNNYTSVPIVVLTVHERGHEEAQRQQLDFRAENVFPVSMLDILCAKYAGLWNPLFLSRIGIAIQTDLLIIKTARLDSMQNCVTTWSTMNIYTFMNVLL